jgi:endonuclease/exonuclease/phosphatase family metal-dependent hydrolase
MGPNAMTIILFAAATMTGCASPGAPAARDPRALRVMSFNIRCATATGDGENFWTHRRDLFFRTIRAFDADLLGAQEVVLTQPQEMREALPDYTFVGVGRDDGKDTGEFSPVLYRTHRFEEVARGGFWLSETPDVIASKSWDSALCRIATWVKLRDRRDGGRELLVFNTHWDHIGKVARVKSAELIRAKMREICGAEQLPVIVIGDFNCTEDDPPYATMIGAPDTRPRLIDSYREVHPQRAADEASFHAFKGTTTGSRIDFIFHTPEYRATSAEIVHTNENGRYPSDHFPVAAVLKRVQ